MAMQERQRPKPSPLGLIDRLVMAIAPEYGARRIAARRRFEAAESRFARIEASESSDTRGDRWLISRLSTDSQLEQDLETARDRSRELYQNDAIGGVIDGKVNHVIGCGHTPQARVKAGQSIDETTAELLNEQLEQIYRDWSPRADISGRRSLWMLSRLAERHNLFDGESFTVLSDVGRADKPIPLALQVIDPMRVSTPSREIANPLVRMGIQTNAAGIVEGYWVRKVHPGDSKRLETGHDFIPADRMLHVFEPWYAEQSRGLPWLVRALNRAKDAKDYDEAAILGAQVEQCYAGFVKPPIGGNAFLSASAATSATSNSGRSLQDIVPGTLKYLEPGEEVVFGNPARPGNMFAPFMEWNYRRVAAAINWPYEMVVKNWNGLSFAAGRLVLTDAKKATEVGQQMMREMWFSRVWQRLVEESVILGIVDADPISYIASPLEFQRHTWIAPKWEYALNPGEEVDADISEISANLSTLEDKLGKRGYDLEELIARRKREEKLLAEAGLSSPEPVTAGRPPNVTPEPQDQEEPVAQ